VPQRLLGCSSGCRATAVVVAWAGASPLDPEVPEQAVASSARMVRPTAIRRARRRWSGVDGLASAFHEAAVMAGWGLGRGG
jgi:non-ribosomal peptide synthetase component F